MVVEVTLAVHDDGRHAHALPAAAVRATAVGGEEVRLAWFGVLGIEHRQRTCLLQYILPRSSTTRRGQCPITNYQALLYSHSGRKGIPVAPRKAHRRIGGLFAR